MTTPDEHRPDPEDERDRQRWDWESASHPDESEVSTADRLHPDGRRDEEP